MQEPLRVCLVQMTSTDNHVGNIAFVEKAAEYAAANQCQLLALPEVAGLMNKQFSEVKKVIVAEPDDPFINACIALARDHQLWIHTGSTPIASPDGRFLNHANLIDNKGVIRSRYDKIHLFDVFLAGSPAIRESKRYAPGTKAALAETPWGAWGMSICYDLRFPQLYRDYAQQGATIQFIPSAFTKPTGAAHWHVLLRARAIETGSFVIAAAQVGTHDDGRETYGHSLVIDPWGKVLLDMGGKDPGMACIALDLDMVSKARAQIPSLQNDRAYQLHRDVKPLS